MSNQERSKFSSEEYVFYDTETTFLKQVCEVSVINCEGHSILHDYGRQEFSLSESADPRDKMLLNKFSDELLSSGSTREQLASKLRHIFENKRVVTWNLQWELKLMPEAFSTAKTVHCAMNASTPFIGRYVRKHGDHCWIKLWDAIDYLGLDVPGVRHRAVTDSLATLKMWEWSVGVTGNIIDDFRGRTPELVGV